MKKSKTFDWIILLIVVIVSVFISLYFGKGVVVHEGFLANPNLTASEKLNRIKNGGARQIRGVLPETLGNFL